MLNSLLHLDIHLFSLINSHHTLFLDKAFLFITWFGNGWVMVPLVAVIIIIKTPRKYLAVTLLCAALIGTLSGVLNTQAKHFFHRDRPILCFTRLGSMMPECNVPVHVVGPVLKYNSFPSGHSNSVFTAVTILALLFGGYFFCGYPVAILVAFSRIYVGAHFPFDTLAGALFGCMVALLFIELFRRLKWLPRSFVTRRNDAQQ
jgi:membrane-associated phospholipid phosphatase